jgi:hypothetical protein
VTRLFFQPLPLVFSLLIGGLTVRPAVAQTFLQPSNLAVLLQALRGQPLGLYDGVRFVGINIGEGSRITVTINCEEELWRVVRVESGAGQPDFRDDPFQGAPGIGSSSWCTESVRTME